MTSTARKIITSLAVVGASAAITVGGATTAAAQQYVSYPLTPGQGVCTPAQYASYQVRADGWATWNGAKLKLLRNGAVVYSTPTRVNELAIELRSSTYTFPGPGYYTWCAQNTGTTNTVATLQLRTDYEF
jgi:hypothetical protein